MAVGGSSWSVARGGGRGAIGAGIGRDENLLRSNRFDALSDLSEEQNTGSSPTIAEELALMKREMEEIKSMLRDMAARPATDNKEPKAVKSGGNQTGNKTEKKEKNKPTMRNTPNNFGGLLEYQQSEHFNRYFIVKLSGDKRKLNPFLLEKEITSKLGGKPTDIAAAGKNAIMITVNDKRQSKEIMTMKTVGGMDCEVSGHRTMNNSKGLIYIYEFDIEDTSVLCDGLSDVGVTSVEEAKWIKPSREGTKAFLLTFNREHAPEGIKIPGESRQTRVYEYKEKPMQCKKCQQYNHTMKYCQAETPVCGKCSALDHESNQCVSTILKCCHCSLQHTAWNRKCETNIFHSEVVSLMQKKKIRRFEATALIRERFPNRNMSYASATKTKSQSVKSHGNLRTELTTIAETLQQHKEQTNEMDVDSSSNKRQIDHEEESGEERSVRSKTEDLNPSIEKENIAGVTDEDDLNDVLMNIYNSYKPQPTHITPSRNDRKSQPKRITTPINRRKNMKNIYTGLIKAKSNVFNDKLMKIAEKIKIARIQYMPAAETGYSDALLIGIEPLPSHIEVADGVTTEIIHAENMNKSQHELFKQLVE